MCVVCVTVAGTVVVASQITPIQVLSDFTASQKTLTSFTGSSSALSSQQKSEIKVLVEENIDAESATCTGIRLSGASSAVATTTRNRAKAACDYAKRLNPYLSTSVVLKTTTAKSFAGRVLVAVRTPVPAPVAAPAPIVVRTPFTTPFPEVFSRSELVKAALDNFSAYVAANSSSKSFELVIDKPHQANATALKAVADRSYAALPFPVGYQKTITVISDDRDFTDKTISEFGFSRSDVNKCINCAGEGWASAAPGSAPWSIIPHEIFHVWQKSAYLRKGNNNPDPNRSENPPVWFDEGGAEFFGWSLDSLYTKNNRDSYPRISGYESGWQPLTRYNTRDFDANGPYMVGRAATEYIVASVGFEKYLQIYRNVGQGQSFPDAFASAVGISLASFYEKFDRLQANFRN
jgi:hypothetical protein